MEPIFGTPASESPSLSPERLVTTDVLVVGQIEEDEATTERNFAFYALKLLSFKCGGRYLTSSMFTLIFNKNTKHWCESTHSFACIVLGMVLKTRGLIKAMFVELASSSSSSSSASSSSLDVYVTPKRIIYERYILGEVSDETSPTYAQLEDGLARIGVTVDMYNNGTTLNDAEWVGGIKKDNSLWKVTGGTSSYTEVTEPVNLSSFPFWTRRNVQGVRTKFSFDQTAVNFVTDADMDTWFPVDSEDASGGVVTMTL